jgi:cytochrome P450
MTITAGQHEVGTEAPATDDMEALLVELLPDSATEVVVPDGATLCRAGDRADTWWFVEDGWADVTVNGIFLGNVGAGETIGELSALDHEPRSATVTARGELRVREATSDELVAGLEARPELAITLTRLLIRRLRRSNELLSTPAPQATVTESAPVRAMNVTVEAEEPVRFDPSASGYFDDPTVQLGAIREREAVHFIEATGAHLLTRYEHVHALARDRRLGADIEHAAPNPVIDAERERLARAFRVKSILRVDGDAHSRVRRLLQGSFTPKRIAQWQERASAVADALLDELAADGGGDLITDYALRLPVQIIADMLGMPTDDVPRLRQWSHVLTRTLDPICTPDEREAAVVANAEMLQYISAVYDDKRRRPDDALLSALITAEDDGERLSKDEVLTNTLLLFVAGHETTTNLIGNGAVELFRHPVQRDLAVARPDLDANLVEEVLRYNSPVQFTRRISIEDIEVDGTHIPAGSVIMLAAVAANRDPRKWGPTADEFQVDRPGANDQVSFGGGPHFCLGAALARLEGRIGLPRLFRRFPKLRTVAEPQFEHRLVLRGVASLPVEI